MYLYSFSRFFGFDKVCLLDDASNKNIKAGDLLVFGNEYFLALGDKIVFPEQYGHTDVVKAELVYKKFLTKPTLELFHRMVETYYTTYKSVMKLFFSGDIEKFLEREGKIKGIRRKGQAQLPGSIFHVSFSFSEEGQTLIVFPDLWTMFNMTDEVFRESEGVAFLSATHTEKQKDIHRREIKNGMKLVILSTYAEIFQDFYNLKKIIFVDPHKRYYANQQDPRYKVGEVLEKMKTLYGAELQIVGI